MRNDASICVTRDLIIGIRTPEGRVEVRLSRLSAQILAATLRSYSGQPSRGVDANAGVFSTVHGQVIHAAPTVQTVVRLK